VSQTQSTDASTVTFGQQRIFGRQVPSIVNSKVGRSPRSDHFSDFGKFISFLHFDAFLLDEMQHRIAERIPRTDVDRLSFFIPSHLL